MTRYEERQRFFGMLRTLLGCTGWGVLGMLLMRQEGSFWIGWWMLLVAVCVAGAALDRCCTPKRWI